MGPGRARSASRWGIAPAGLLLAATLLLGCGESRHANQPRPQVSRRVSVTISPSQVIVQPAEIAAGPERHQQIPQNQNSPQPAIKTTKPLAVTFVIANQTARASTVRVLGRSRLLGDVKVPARSPATMQVELPAGAYAVSATGAPKTGRLAVGSYRASSQNDVLLP